MILKKIICGVTKENITKLGKIIKRIKNNKIKIMKTKGISKEITKIFNKLADKELQNIRLSEIKEHAKKTDTKVLKKYISDRKNSEWNINCSIANDELIKRGEK